jgi:hypothetical protein
MWDKDWNKVMLSPGHDPFMSKNYPEIAEGVTQLV